MIRSIALAACLAGLAACAPDGPPDRLQGYGEVRYVYVAAEDGGRLAAVLPREGDAVDAGDPLFRLEPERLALSARAARAEAEAAARRAEAGGVWDEAVAQARAQARLAQADFDRAQTLFDRGIAAQARLDSARAALDAAQAALARAEAEREAAGDQTRSLDTAAALAERRVSDLAVVAPVAGVVDRIYRRPGEVVAAGEPLAALITPEGMRVRFFAPQALLARLPPGAAISFACDGCASGLTGRISFVATEPEFTPPVIYSREERDKLVFLIEATPDDPAAIRPGLPVEIILPNGTDPE
jgi:HlyD family secretion protein